MYRYAVVTFLDVLGFRSLVAHESAEHINGILAKMRAYAGRDSDDEDKDPYQPVISTFSDCVVRTNFTDSQSNLEFQIGLLFFELLGLVHAQSQLIDSGVIVRGGIAFGDIVHEGDLVFGPAMVDAYELESKHAIYPRIVLSSEWVAALKNNPLLRSQNDTVREYEKQIRKLIRKDEDGTFFVDYIRAVQSELDDPEADYLVFLEKHASLIKKNLKRYAADTGVLKKYVWLSKYHNALIEELSEGYFEHYGYTKKALLTAMVVK